MQGSSGIDEELHAQGQRLLRLVVRAYFDVEFSILLTAFLHLAPSGQSLRATEVADYLQLSEKQVAGMLGILSQMYLLHRTTITEERPEPPAGAPTQMRREIRPRSYDTWRVDYESTVKLVKYKHSEMLKALDAPVDKVEYLCANSKCIFHNKVYSLEEVVLSSHLADRARARQSQSFLIDSSSSASAAGGDGGSGEGAPRTDTFASFPCHYCKTPMQEKSQLGHSAGDLKRAFNEQVEEVNEQMREVDRLLRDKHELVTAHGLSGEAAAVATGRAGGAGTTGVGARVGYSSAADLANRAEKNKELLAWDRLSADEQAARDRDEMARQAAAAEAAAKLAEAKQIRERELEREEELRRAEKARVNAQLEQELMAAALGTTAPAPTSTAALAAAAAAATVSAGVKQEPVQEAPAQEAAAEEPAAAQEEEEEEEVTVMVQGAPVRVSEITDAHLEMMTEEENAAYNALFE